MLRKTTLELGTLSIGQWRGFGDAVPQLFDQRQPLLDAEPFDAE